MTFGARLRELRQNKGMTQAELAKALALGESTISFYEADKREPDYQTLKAVADFFGVTTDYLLGRTDDPRGMVLPRNAWKAGPMVRVPVLGVIRAGLPIYADEQLIGWQELPSEWVKDGEYFLLRVTGDSMIGDNIPPGSLVLVRRQDYIEDGKTGIVIVNGEEATVKRVRFKEGMVLLYPANPKYETQVYPASEVKIIGKVVKTVIDNE